MTDGAFFYRARVTRTEEKVFMVERPYTQSKAHDMARELLGNDEATRFSVTVIDCQFCGTFSPRRTYEQGVRSATTRAKIQTDEGEKEVFACDSCKEHLAVNGIKWTTE